MALDRWQQELMKVLPPPTDAWGVAWTKPDGTCGIWVEVFRSREEAAMHVNISMRLSPRPGYCTLTVIPVQIRPLARIHAPEVTQ